jgi:tRNA(His) 5'-end guanylyltransferase
MQPVAVNARCLTLAGSTMVVEAYDDTHRQERLASVAADVFGGPVSFTFQTLSRPAAPGSTSVKNRLLRHPLVDEIKDLFSARLVDCRENRDSPARENPRDA